MNHHAYAAHPTPEPRAASEPPATAKLADGTPGADAGDREPDVHRRVPSGSIDWRCACGEFGNHGGKGYAAHLPVVPAADADGPTCRNCNHPQADHGDAEAPQWERACRVHCQCPGFAAGGPR